MSGALNFYYFDSVTCKVKAGQLVGDRKRSANSLLKEIERSSLIKYETEM